MKLNLYCRTSRVACFPSWVVFALSLTTFLAARAKAADNGIAVPEPAIISRSLDQRIWQTVTAVNTGDKTILRTNSYKELGTGICFTDSNGQILDSQEVISIMPNGYGLANQGQHSALFSPSIIDSPAVDYLDGQGHRFQTRILGLAYFDYASGKSVLFCETKDSIGQIDPATPNIITYPDAFSDGVKASVRFSYKKSSFSQDILIMAKLPSPAEVAPGLNAQTVRLQVWTEMFAPPVPTVKNTTFIYQEKDDAIRQTYSEPDFKDDFLEFGTLQIGRGTAFVIDSEAIRQAGINVAEEVPVGKEIAKTAEQRSFLIESIELSLAQPLLDTLETASIRKENKNAQQAAVKRPTARSHSLFLASLPKAAKKKQSDSKILLAQDTGAKTPSRILCLDYSTVITSTNVLFSGDTTYFVDSAVNLSGTNTCEGGAVIKFSTNSSQIKITGSGARLDFLTSAYRPAIFSGKDDNSCGTAISGSTGNPAGKWYA